MGLLRARFKVQVSWSELARRTFYATFFKDNCLGMAAQLAYYFFFALFPALIVLIAIASFFPPYQLVDETVRILGEFAPPEVLRIIADQMRTLTEREQGGLLTAGMLTALWTSSSAMTAIVDTLNRAYDVEEGRAWWRVRLLAITLTIGAALFILVSVAFVLAGPTLAEYVADWWYLGAAFEWTWKVLQWPLVFGLVSVGMALIYYFAPDVEQEWAWLTPGSLLATTLWLLATLGLKYYVVNMGEYEETYGAIGAVMVLLLWFYVSGLVILIGAELNAEIEHASFHGKDPGEKVPGQHRAVGAGRMRRWMAQRRARGEGPPTADEVKEAVTASGDERA
jgi:membrane protein